MKLEFFVPATPRPKGNSKEIVYFGKRLGLKGKDTHRAAEKALVWLLREHKPEEPLVGALKLDVTFGVPIPESWSAHDKLAAREGRILPTSAPDRGQYLKLVEDALQRAGFYKNDAAIVSGDVSKRYSDVPGYMIQLEELPCLPRP